MKPRHLLAALFALFALGCGAPQGPHIRYAQASPDQLAAVEAEDVVWYDFEPGDELPLMFAFLGMAEAGSEVRMVVKRRFSIVMMSDGRSFFSFDGKNLVADPFSRWGFLLGRGEQRGTTALLMYVGPANEAPEALR